MAKQQSFGSELKKIRKQKNISQQKLCEGICSQPMLSAIEAGKYIPNSKILVQLCERLGIGLDNLMLEDHYPISSVVEFNERCELLCNQHQYGALQNFLLEDKVIASIETSFQMEAYYYYLGCAQFHLEKNKEICERSFKLALAEAGNQVIKSALTRQVLVSLGLLFALKNQMNQSDRYFKLAFDKLSKLNYEKNLNILFYLKAFACFSLGNYPQTLITVNEGIEFAGKHDNHYMLANLYYLLSLTAEETKEPALSQESAARSKLFNELFHEIIYTGDNYKHTD